MDHRRERDARRLRMDPEDELTAARQRFMERTTKEPTPLEMYLRKVREAHELLGLAEPSLTEGAKRVCSKRIVAWCWPRLTAAYVEGYNRSRGRNEENCGNFALALKRIAEGDVQGMAGRLDACFDKALEQAKAMTRRAQAAADMRSTLVRRFG